MGARPLWPCSTGSRPNGQDWKCRHLVFNAEGQALAFNGETLKSMFESKRGQVDNVSVRAVVSMQQNPARFWPCRDQRVSVSSADSASQSQGQAGAAADPPPTKLCHTGHVQQCSYHSQHNALDDLLKVLDPELLNRVVSVIKTAKNSFNEPDMRQQSNTCSAMI
jgi:hypothetical protein